MMCGRVCDVKHERVEEQFLCYICFLLESFLPLTDRVLPLPIFLENRSHYSDPPEFDNNASGWHANSWAISSDTRSTIQILHIIHARLPLSTLDA